MFRTAAAVLVLLCTTAPVWAVEPEPFDPDQPFRRVLTTSLLRSLLDEALDRLEDHIEIRGNMDSADDGKGDHRGYFQLRFYPEGRSQSDEHLTAEGWVHSWPEAGQQDWHLRFRLPTDRPRTSPLPFEDPL
jgi:hypothetical protein